MLLTPAEKPTMYFIGVTTGQSSIMKVFPAWMEALGLDSAIKGVDIGLHAPPETYRQVVEFIKGDPLSLGALVTTHKIDLYNAAHDLFDRLDPYAASFGELSCISKEGGKLWGHAKDPVTCGMALEEFLPPNYWRDHPKAGVMIMGAGGSCISMCAYFMRPEFAGNYPAKLVVANRSEPRLKELQAINERLNPAAIPCEYHLTPLPGQNDAVLAAMAEGSLIINATGLGKDRPGSPLGDGAPFPRDAIVWEINYRGDLAFLRQAKAQARAKRLKVQDGWMYFIFGWTQVMAEVYHRPIEGETLAELSNIAAAFNGR